jgi:hypothetical protein
MWAALRALHALSVTGWSMRTRRAQGWNRSGRWWGCSGYTRGLGCEPRREGEAMMQGGGRHSSIADVWTQLTRNWERARCMNALHVLDNIDSKFLRSAALVYDWYCHAAQRMTPPWSMLTITQAMLARAAIVHYVTSWQRSSTVAI